MSEITRVALDAMGGDNAPREIVKGAVEAVRKRKDIKVLLTGKEDVIRKELSAYTYPEEQIEIVNATEQMLLYLQEVQELFLLEDRFL